MFTPLANCTHNIHHHPSKLGMTEHGVDGPSRYSLGVQNFSFLDFFPILKHTLAFTYLFELYLGCNEFVLWS
jgi:hypothetical protein